MDIGVVRLQMILGGCNIPKTPGKATRKHECSDEDEEPNLRLQAAEILQFLNEKTGRAFKPVRANLDLIVHRLQEGATKQECMKVIALKHREWGKDKAMKTYVRPKTLFSRTNYAQYSGELV